MVGDFDGRAAVVVGEAGVFVFLFVEFVLSLELGEEALDGGDDDLVDGVVAAGAEVLKVVDLAEEAAVVGWLVVLELALGLGAERFAVDEEEDAPEFGELDEPVDLGDGGEGLAGVAM